MAARTDQGVFNMNGNPELNVDFSTLRLRIPIQAACALARLCRRLS